MKIQLSQTNIVEGIKMYLQSQGIKMQGRDIQVLFTAGRKQSGLIADVDIEDNSDIGSPITDVPYKGDESIPYPEDTKPQSWQVDYPAETTPAVEEVIKEEEVETAQTEKASLFG